jgi:hypothetical protein
MTFLLENSKLDFLTGIVVQVEVGTIIELRIRVARTQVPNAWETEPYQIEVRGTQARARFIRRGNWPRVSVEVIGRRLGQPSAGFEISPRLSEHELASNVAQASMVFLGCARDCESDVARSISAVQKLRGLFGTSAFHVFENDSRDGTLEILRQFNRQGILTLHSEEGLDEVMPKRTERLAYARNTLMASALDKQTYEYICWVDLDGLIDEAFDARGFLSCFQYEEAWDAVFPVNTGYYYDIWALRHPVMWPSDYLIQMNSEFDLALGDRSIVEIAMKSRQIKADAMRGWLPVESAFGGMAIYKAQVCRNGRYVGLEDGREVCEHVSFNRALFRSGGALYINPEFRIPCPREHLLRNAQ